MKAKTKQKIWAVLGTLVMLLPLFLGLGQASVKAADETEGTPVTIHKKKMKMTDLPDPLIQNTGKEMGYFDSYEGLDGVEFKVYDVTEAYYTKLAEVKDRTKAMEYVRDNYGTEEVDTKITKDGGTAEFNLPEKSHGMDAVYVFVETPQTGVTAAVNMVLGFPAYEMNADGSFTDNKLTAVHLYPKNVISQGEVEIKKMGTDGELLAGVSFTLQYKADENGDIAAYADKYFANDYDDKGYAIFGDTATTLLTDANGLLKVTGLPDGHYILTETGTIDGYSQNGQQSTFEFDIEKGAVVALENPLFEVEGYDYGDPTTGAGINKDLFKDETNDMVIENLLNLGGIDFIKKDINSKIVLAGAEFKIAKDNGENKDVFLMEKETEDGYKYAWSDEVTEAAGYTEVVLTSNRVGQFRIMDLKQGTYYLVETKAPDGYVLPADGLYQSFTVTDKSATDTVLDEVVNQPKGVLPSTGGKGIIAFVAIGVALVGGVGFYFMKRSKSTEA